MRSHSAWRYFTGQAPMVASPARTVVAVGVEGRVNVNQIHAGVGQLGELFQIVAAINDTGVEEGGGSWQAATIGFGGRDALRRVRADRQVSPTGGSFRAGNLFGHAAD